MSSDDTPEWAKSGEFSYPAEVVYQRQQDRKALIEERDYLLRFVALLTMRLVHAANPIAKQGEIFVTQEELVRMGKPVISASEDLPKNGYYIEVVE